MRRIEKVEGGGRKVEGGRFKARGRRFFAAEKGEKELNVEKKLCVMGYGC